VRTVRISSLTPDSQEWTAALTSRKRASGRRLTGGNADSWGSYDFSRFALAAVNRRPTGRYGPLLSRTKSGVEAPVHETCIINVRRADDESLSVLIADCVPTHIGFGSSTLQVGTSWSTAEVAK
jgi:hypothetical protein